MTPPSLLDVAHRLRTGARTGAALLATRPHYALLPLLVGAGLAIDGAVGGLVALVTAVAIIVVTPDPLPGEARPALPRETDRAALVRLLDRGLSRSDGDPVAMVIEIDRYRTLTERFDHATLCRLSEEILRRLGTVLRQGDVVVALDTQTFGIAIDGDRRLDLPAAMQLAGRLQRALADPFDLDRGRNQVTASIGFGLGVRLERPDGEAMLQAATLAALEAHRNGPSAIRSYSSALRDRVAARNALADEVAAALDRGEFCAHYQPQVDARTGALTGVEALARWRHPVRGMIPPSEFLPALQIAGRMGALGTMMVHEALSSLKAWDAEGLRVPRVAVNFSHDELADPRLLDRIGWELDRLDLTPDRLVIEVLETVVASGSEDIVVRNLAGLARLGCRLDLDDFGTGHAAITSIRRFAIERIKIDRSFVTRIDADPEQQKMVQAILTMAERLDLDTLAEGVETPAEQKMLADLGCGHLQGYGIARPMPAAEFEAWVAARQNRVSAPIPFQRSVG